MSAKRILINCVLSCLLVSIFILTHHEPAYSAQPGVDLYHKVSGVSTRTGPTSDPEDPYFTALWHSAKVVDYDGISNDGGSHVVTVTYPNGSIKPLYFFYTIDEHSAVYSLWDDTIDFWDESKTPPEPDPWTTGTYSGNYVYRVVDPTGQSGEATDHLEVKLIEPPDERTFSPGFGFTQTITAYFDEVCAYDEDGIEIGCDDFSEGFVPYYWQSKPPEISYIDGQACFDITWDNTSRNIRMETLNPEWIYKLKAKVRVSSIIGYAPTARIGGTYCQDEKGNILARVGIRKTKVGDQDEHEAYYTLYRNYDEGGHSISENFVPPIRIDKVDLGKNYEISLQWEETTSTFTFEVIGLDDAVNKTATYTLTGIISQTYSPSRFIDTACWLTLDTTTPTFRWDPVSNPHVTHYRVRIDSNGHTVYSGYEKSCELKCPPGVLKPNGDYKYRVYAQEHHQRFEWENAGNSNMNKMNFTAGSIESQDPYIDLDSVGVSAWTLPPPGGGFTWFHIKIYDAQGVPDNIEAVMVKFPDESTMTLDLAYNESAVCGVYLAAYDDQPPQPGEYTFTVEDKDGNNAGKSELLPLNAIGYPPESSLRPLNHTVLIGTEGAFSWDEVAEASFYELVMYDEDENDLFRIRTTDIECRVPSGILEERSRYGWRVITRREFFEDNFNNGSIVPLSDEMYFFTTGSVGCEGDFEPDGDVDGSDLAVFASNFGRTNCDSGPPCEGDFDKDGDVDGTDLAVFAADFGRTDCPCELKLTEVDSFSSPGFGPSGLAFDKSENYLWCADQEEDSIYKLTTVCEIDSFIPSPGLHPTGLTFDGTHFWNSDGFSSMIYQLDTSGSILSSFDAPGSDSRGLAFDGTYLWSADFNWDFPNGLIHKIETSGTPVSSFNSPGPEPTGLTFDGTYLWNLDLSKNRIYKLTTDGEVIKSCEVPGEEPIGLTFDGTYFWLSDGEESKIYKLTIK